MVLKNKDLYITTVENFGNGAKLKASKKNLGKEMMVVSKESFKEMLNDMIKKPLSDSEKKRIDRIVAKKWAEAQDNV